MKYAITIITVCTPAYVDVVVVDVIDSDVEIKESKSHYSYMLLDRIDTEIEKGAYRISKHFIQNERGIVILTKKSVIEKLQYGRKISQMYIDEWAFEKECLNESLLNSES